MQLVGILLLQPQWPCIRMAYQRQQKIWNTPSFCSKDHFMKIFHWININSSPSGFSSQRIQGQPKCQPEPPSLSFDIYIRCLPLSWQGTGVAASLETNPSQCLYRWRFCLSSRALWTANRPSTCESPLRPGGADQFIFITRLLEGSMLQKEWREGRKERSLKRDDFVSIVLGARNPKVDKQHTLQRSVLIILSTATKLAKSQVSGPVLTKPLPADPPTIFLWISLPTSMCPVITPTTANSS